jgi:hypothetical protein
VTAANREKTDMAKLMLIGAVAQVELTSDPEDDQIVATCAMHAPWGRRGCGWTQRYDTLDDAAEYATDHADSGRG